MCNFIKTLNKLLNTICKALKLFTTVNFDNDLLKNSSNFEVGILYNIV